ncbi:osmoprotectant ABC transporter substrate-binding protein [Aerococcus viridans]|nr:osmoprotectant ABC transporter substrate-binding protein [Aerococcus viridans]
MRKMKYLKTSIVAVLSTIILTACSLPGLGGSTENGISIVSGSTTERQILGYLVEGMVQHYIDTPTNIIPNLGSSTMNQQALETGDANVSAVNYTGTSLTGELGMEAETDPEVALETVISEFDSQFDMHWYTPGYGFANTYAFMVRREDAEEYGLETVSDLEEYADEFSVGVDNTWLNREGDGYDAFKEVYGFEFSELYPMTIGLVYSAVSSGEVDVVLGYSTDGRIISEDLVVLEDDKRLFPPYDGAPVATNEAREEFPELDGIFQKLANTISDETMQELNFQSDQYLLEPQVVADRFLEENNYFEDAEPFIEPVSQDNLGGEE